MWMEFGKSLPVPVVQHISRSYSTSQGRTAHIKVYVRNGKVPVVQHISR